MLSQSERVNRDEEECRELQLTHAGSVVGTFATISNMR